jgi:hypothetical protein
MTIHRTAQGRTLDMATLIAKNEKIRAVGNMKVNARGDTIDGKGNIVKPRNQQVTEQYGKTIGAKPLQTNKPTNKIETVVEDKLPSEHDFNDNEDLEIEQIKQQEVTKKGKK